MDKQREGENISEKLIHYKEINNALHVIANAVTVTNSLSALYAKIHDALKVVIDTTNFYIAHYDSEEDSISFPYIIDTVDLCYPKALNVSKTASLTATVIRTKQPLLIRKDDIVSMQKESGRIVPACTVAEIWLGVPLQTVNGIIGVMAVQSYSNPDCFSESDVDIMVSVADMVAIAIERKRMEDALKQSEEMFRRIVTTVREGIVSMDAENRITFVNAYLAEILGYEQEELVGQKFEKLLSTDERQDFLRRQEVRKGGIQEQFERKFSTKNGAEIWTIISASPLFDAEGHFIGSFGTVTNIHERKKAEIALQQKNIELQNAMNQIKTLHGILPICAHCKKIRDDKGYWNQVEVYVRNHTEAEFSHSVCPECIAILYPEYSGDD